MASTKATARVVDFSNVKEGGNFNKSRIPEGDYLAKIVKVEDAESKGDKIPMFLFSIKIQSRATSVFPYYCKLQENQLWKLRNIALAAGKAVPKSKTKFDPNGLVGKLIGVTIVDTEYDGKEQSEVDAVFPASDLPDGVEVPGASDDEGEEAEEESVEDIEDLGDEAAEEPAEEAEEAEEEAEEEEAEEADPYEGLSRVEIKKQIKAHNADFVAKKSQTDEDLITILRELDAAPAASEDDDEDLEDLDVDAI